MESATEATPNRGYHLVRIAVAVLLLTASVLKCWQLATEPIIGNSLLESRWLLMATVEFELFFGIWLLANIWAKPTWAAALACFGLFTCVSLCKAISGHATCGCFGRVPVNPWFTTTLDLGVIIALLRWRPSGRDQVSFSRLATVLCLGTIIGMPAAIVVYGNAIAPGIRTVANVTVLQPDKWVGTRFPLFDEIDIGDRLRVGEWNLLLYHFDCQKCQDAIKELKSKNVPLACIEVPPCQNEKPTTTSYMMGQLQEGHEWFVATPVILHIKDQHVIEVSQ